MDTLTVAERSVLSRWLCRDQSERQRWSDMCNRVKYSRLVMGFSVCSTGLFAAPWFGWWLVGVVIVGGSIILALELPGAKTPEIDAVAIVAIELVVAGGVAASGGAESPFLSFIVLPVIIIGVVFRTGVVAWGVVMCLVVTATAMLTAPLFPPPPDTPPILNAVTFVALLAGLQAAALSLLSAEMQSRVEAVVDPLTGLFNRTSLPRRFSEVAAQARALGGPVGVAMLDLDHFKKVNDTYGHDRGDVVLREVAYSLRKSLRHFDLVYRLGGEEFAMLLPGLDLDAAREVAQRVIADVAGTPMAGLAVTMSAGVASGRGEALELSRMLKAADVALYEAKHAGRNRVHPPAPQPAPPRRSGTLPAQAVVSESGGSQRPVPP